MEAIPLVDLKAQYDALAAEVDAALAGVLRDMNLILGPELGRFEAEFAAYLETGHVVGVGSGLDALVLALRACGLPPGGEVLVPALSFVASASAVVLAGGIPRFVDVDPDTLLMDLADARNRVTHRTWGLMPVHLYGQMVPMDEVLEFAGVAGLVVIEDAAQAHGASYRGRKAGTWGKAGCFSFYPGKNLGAYGEGGAIATADPGVADAVKVLRNQGSRSKHEHTEIGYNSRMDELQAAVLRIKLRRLDAWNAARRERAALYDRSLAGSACEPVVTVRPESAARHLYVVRTPDRDRVLAGLREAAIGAGVHYPVPLHRQPALASYADRALPVAERAAQEVLSLPLYPELTPAQLDRVVAEVLRLVTVAAG